MAAGDQTQPAGGEEAWWGQVGKGFDPRGCCQDCILSVTWNHWSISEQGMGDVCTIFKTGAQEGMERGETTVQESSVEVAVVIQVGSGRSR